MTLTIFVRTVSQLPCRTSQLILALQIYEKLALKTLNTFIGEKLILHLILESFMSSSLSTGITHLAQLILKHRSIRLYKQRDTNDKLHGKIILYIPKIIYLWHMWHEDKTMICTKGFIVTSFELTCITHYLIHHLCNTLSWFWLQPKVTIQNPKEWYKLVTD